MGSVIAAICGQLVLKEGDQCSYVLHDTQQYMTSIATGRNSLNSQIKFVSLCWSCVIQNGMTTEIGKVILYEVQNDIVHRSKI